MAIGADIVPWHGLDEFLEPLFVARLLATAQSSNHGEVGRLYTLASFKFHAGCVTGRRDNGLGRHVQIQLGGRRFGELGS